MMSEAEPYRPLVSIKNQFRGINPILNDVLQTNADEDDRWHEFHGHYMTSLTRQLMAQLRGIGYTARMQKGLQIRDTGDEPVKTQINRETDITNTSTWLNNLYKSVDLSGYTLAIKPATAFVADPKIYGKVKALNGIGIYGKAAHHLSAWIEVLSPDSKAGSEYYSRYLRKRELFLESKSATFIEIDFLNQTPPAIYGYPDYTQHESGATPYRISVVNFRSLEAAQNLADVQASIIGFGVDQSIPVVSIQLEDGFSMELDAQSAYDRIFQDFYYGEENPIDYRRIPASLNTYTQKDQQRLLKRLLAINLAWKQGVDLNEVDQPVPVDQEAVEMLISELGNQSFPPLLQYKQG